MEVSAVSLGTWGYSGPTMAGDVSVGWSGHDDQHAREALVEAHRRGINHWDTADVYGNGNAERLIGSVWDEVPREEIFLATKVGWDAGRFDHYYHPELMAAQLDKSLANLQTDVIDLYYFHHCDFGPNDEHRAAAIDTMRQFQKEGRIRFIGLSDWSAEKIVHNLETVDPDVVQPYRNVVNDDYEASGLAAAVSQRNLGVAFFSPLKHGLLLGKYEEPVSFPEGDVRERVAEFHDPAAISRYRAAAASLRDRYSGHPQPVLHALVGALLSDAPTACVLLGQRNRSQVDDAAEAGQPLPAEDAAFVRALYRP